MRGIDLNALEPEGADTPLGRAQLGGQAVRVTGGVMEAAVRTAHRLVTGEELAGLKLQNLRGLKGVKHARVQLDGVELGVAVVSGLANAARLLEDVQAGRVDLHFVEVMTCPGGCIAGGGQPLGTDLDAVKARMRALYQIDRDAELRRSHENASVQRLYDAFLGAPLSEKSHHLLHTRYAKREVVG
jgi:NADP-reducing hydrogenase subunit HndD